MKVCKKCFKDGKITGFGIASLVIACVLGAGLFILGRSIAKKCCKCCCDEDGECTCECKDE